jgi:hypothetical protein
MSLFIHLNVPHLDQACDLWYVSALHERIYLTKSGDLEHEDFIDPRDMGKIYFDAELDAFRAIAVYYAKYNRTNPYLSQWSDACDDMEVSNETLNEVIESQVMEFI